MGFAMLHGWKKLGGYTFTVVEPNEDLLKRAVASGAPQALAEVSEPIDVLVIATKPQMVAKVIEHHADRLSPTGLIISVAAGVGIAAMASCVQQGVAIIRAMPNTPAAISEGMIVCCTNDEARDERYRSIAAELLSATGRLAFVEDEGLMDAVTAVSGSGPAYVFHFIEALHGAAVAAGLDDDLALLLAKQTVFGAAKLARESDLPPATLREQVTSPNGTTAAALAVLMAPGGGLQYLLAEAVFAAKQRSLELGR
jgi:pyrroline-5-carboxylate reductase